MIYLMRPICGTEDMHLVTFREMTDFVECRDLVLTVWWKGNPLTHKEYSHFL